MQEDGGRLADPNLRVESLPIMVLRLKRRVALLLVLLLGFAQINVAVAACSMDRGMLGHEITLTADQTCDGCGGVSDRDTHAPNICVAHCTADLQAAVASVSLVRAPSDAPVLTVAQVAPALLGRLMERVRAAAPPLRVLLHSFLI